MMSSQRSIEAIFVSPHLDDVALSCGGTVGLLGARGPVEIVSCFAAMPTGQEPETPLMKTLHAMWGGPDADPRALWQIRLDEDAEAVHALGARRVWLPYLDALYRSPRYCNRAGIFGPIPDDEEPLRAALIADLLGQWQRGGCPPMYFPLGAGGHVDHKICASLAPALRREGVDIYYYEDFPYSVKEPEEVARSVAAVDRPLTSLVVQLSEELLERRITACTKYRSQLSMLFEPPDSLESATRRYCSAMAAGSGPYAERFWH